MDSVCAVILVLAEQRDAVALVSLAAAGLLLLFGEGRWHPLLLWPLCATLALLAGGPPLCEMVLLRVAVGSFVTLILLVTPRERSSAGWRLFLGSLTMRALALGLAAILAVSFLEATSLAAENAQTWQALVGCGALGAAHCLVSRTPRGVAAGTAALLLVLEASLWLLRPSLLVLAGCGAVTLLVALGGALHQDVQTAHGTAEKVA